LRQIGIIVDSESAVKKYAISLGVTVDMLTESQRKQAILNEALEQGRQKFSNLPSGIAPTTLALKQLRVTLSEIAETLVAAIEKKIGPSISSLSGSLKEFGTDISLWLKDKLGDSATASAAHLERLKREMKSLSAEVTDFEEWGKEVSKSDPYGYSRYVVRAHQIESVKKRISELKSVIEEQEKGAKPDDREKSETIVEPTLLGMTREQSAAIAADRASTIAQIREIELQASLGTQQEAAAREAYLVALSEESRARIDELNAQGVEKVKNLADKELLIRAQADDKRMKVFKEGVKSQEKTYQEMISNMQMGNKLWTLGTVAAFKAVSHGAGAMAKAIRQAVLGAVADEAEAKGAKPKGKDNA
jgi:hypothetical protein